MILVTLRCDACFVTTDGSQFRGRELCRSDRPKIFPIPLSTMAVVVPGFGKLGGLPIDEAMSEFFAFRLKQLPKMTPADAIQSVGAFFAPAARIAMMVCPDDFAGGFMVVGWGQCKCGHPHCYQLSWIKSGGAITESLNPGVDIREGPALILAGAASKTLEHHLSKPESRMRLMERDGFAFHDELHAEALAAKVPDARYRPAGALDKLLITPKEWWRNPPVLREIGIA